MKKAFFLVGLMALGGCASSGQQHAAVAAQSLVENRTIATVAPKPGMLGDIPLKPMTASQSAARMN